MKRVGPVLGAAKGVAKRGDGFCELALFQVGDAQGVIAVGGGGIDADGLFKKIRSAGEILDRTEGRGLERNPHGLRETEIRASSVRAASMYRAPCTNSCLRLRALVAGQIAQQNILGSIFQRNAELIGDFDISLGGHFGLKLFQRVECGAG